MYMPVFFLYLLKLSIGICAVYLFYRLLLQRLTFYRYNRWYMLVYPLLCFVIPLIDVAPLISGEAGNNGLVMQYIPVVGHYLPPSGNGIVAAAQGFSIWPMAWLAVLAGMVLLAGRLLLQWYSFRRMAQKAALISRGDINLYSVGGDMASFSFANAIYLNTTDYTETELAAIVKHEYVHVRQKHTIDIVLAELICIVNWYNPFVWLLRGAIRQNLEFIADSTVLQHGADKKAYQYLLLKVVGVPQFRIANAFNFSSLKKRIVMMNKIKSARVHLFKFLFVLPLVAILLLAFRDKAPLGNGYDAGSLQQHKISDCILPVKQASISPALESVENAGDDMAGKIPIENIYYANGMVLDGNTLTPVAGVKVKDEVSGRTAITGADGYYCLEIPVTGRQVDRRCFFSATGYQTAMYAGLTLLDNRNEKAGSMVFVGITSDGNNGFVKGTGLPKKDGSIVTRPTAAELQQLYETTKADIIGQREAAAAEAATKASVVQNTPGATQEQLQEIFSRTQQPYHYINGVHYLVNEQGGHTALAAGWPLMIEANGVLYTGERLNSTFSRQQLGNQYRVRDASDAEKAAHNILVVLVAVVK
jgi:hypothetical protein